MTVQSLPPRLWRLLAVLTAGVVIVLGASSVSPQFHAWLHADREARDCGGHAHGCSSPAFPAESSAADLEHACAVTLYAQGLVTAAPLFLAPPCAGRLRALDSLPSEQLAPIQPRYLHRPPQAPPVV